MNSQNVRFKIDLVVDDQPIVDENFDYLNVNNPVTIDRYAAHYKHYKNFQNNLNSEYYIPEAQQTSFELKLAGILTHLEENQSINKKVFKKLTAFQIPFIKFSNDTTDIKHATLQLGSDPHFAYEIQTKVFYDTATQQFRLEIFYAAAVAVARNTAENTQHNRHFNAHFNIALNQFAITNYDDQLNQETNKKNIAKSATNAIEIAKTAVAPANIFTSILFNANKTTGENFVALLTKENQQTIFSFYQAEEQFRKHLKTIVDVNKRATLEKFLTEAERYLINSLKQNNKLLFWVLLNTIKLTFTACMNNNSYDNQQTILANFGLSVVQEIAKESFHERFKLFILIILLLALLIVVLSASHGLILGAILAGLHVVSYLYVSKDIFNTKQRLKIFFILVLFTLLFVVLTIVSHGLILAMVMPIVLKSIGDAAVLLLAVINFIFVAYFIRQIKLCNQAAKTFNQIAADVQSAELKKSVEINQNTQQSIIPVEVSMLQSVDVNENNNNSTKQTGNPVKVEENTNNIKDNDGASVASTFTGNKNEQQLASRNTSNDETKKPKSTRIFLGPARNLGSNKGSNDNFCLIHHYRTLVPNK